MGFWLRWGGILLGAFSLFSLAHHRYAFALVPAVQDALEHYRSALHLLAAFLWQKLGPGLGIADLSWSAETVDFVVIYLILAVLLFWLYLLDDLEWAETDKEKITWWSFLVRALLALCWPVLLPGALFLILLGRSDSSLRSWGLEITKALLLFVILYGANASLLTVL